MGRRILVDPNSYWKEVLQILDNHGIDPRNVLKLREDLRKWVYRLPIDFRMKRTFLHIRDLLSRLEEYYEHSIGNKQLRWNISVVTVNEWLEYYRNAINTVREHLRSQLAQPYGII